MKRFALVCLVAAVMVTPSTAYHFKYPRHTIKLKAIGTFASGIFDDGGAEIVAYDKRTKRLFVVNAGEATVDVLDISDPTDPLKVDQIDTEMADPGKSLGNANSVDVERGIVAVAIEADPTQEPGIVAFYDSATLELLNTVEVGALPDMLTFVKNGKIVLVANEGEPNDDYDVDPEGSVSVIDLKRGVARASVRTAGFGAFNDQKDELIEAGVRIFGPGATVAQDLEPEYIAASDSKVAWVTLQENNAVEILDIKRVKIVDIVPLGTKNHRRFRNRFDASNRDDAINLRPWPVHGMFQPDAIASYKVGRKTFYVTANEGDARDYDGFSKEERVGDLELDADAFPDAVELQQEENLGRLNSTTASGDDDGDGAFERIFSYGARSFSIWSSHGRLVYDSGSEFEEITAKRLPDDFNSNNDENDSFDARSDDKGPEPEGVVVGRVLGRQYAFITLERVGGVMVYDVTNPYRPFFVDYVNNRDFAAADALDAGDLGPEGLEFIPWYESPTRRSLLAVGNEVSGTTTLFQIDLKFRRRR